MHYEVVSFVIACSFATIFLFIFLLHKARLNKDRARISEDATRVAAVEKFEEIFGILPHSLDRGSVHVAIRRHLDGLAQQMFRDVSYYEKYHKDRVEAITIAGVFGYKILTTYEARERIRAKRKESARLASGRVM